MLYNVYVIKSVNLYKIGITSDIDRRIKTLSLGNPHGLHVAYISEPMHHKNAVLIERMAHILLQDYALGREWFSCTFEQALDAVSLQIQTTPIPATVLEPKATASPTTYRKILQELWR